MPKVALYNMAGEQIGDIELSEVVFGQEVNTSVIHQVVVNHLANQRQGTQSTKTRAEVRGGGRKPWKQKGTGRARQGSIRSPQWTGGGIAFGPKPRSFNYTINKKVKRLAMKCALSSKVLENELIVVDTIDLPEIKTKEMVAMLKNLGINTKALLVLAEKNDIVYKSARNIEGLNTIPLNNINVYDIIKYDKFITTLDAIKKLEEVYA